MAPPAVGPGDSLYWNIISSAAAARVNTHDLWQALREHQDELPPGSPRPTFAGVSALRSLAVSQRRASEAFDRLGPSGTLMSDVISQDIASRGLAEQAIAPQYLVRFETTYQLGGHEFTQWLTQTLSAALPATKGDLLDMLSEAAPDLALGSDLVQGEPTGRVSISAV